MAKQKKRDSETPVLDDDARAPQSSGDTTASNTDRERVAERAYQKYVERGGRDGSDLDDWLEAERELVRNRRSEDDDTPDSAA